MTTPTPPAGSTRPGNKGLLAATTALAAALAVALATGVVKSPSTPPAVTQVTGCPSSLPGGVVVRYADATDTAGVVARGDIAPVVICGSNAIAYAMYTYIEWVNAGACPCRNGAVSDTTSNPFSRVILSPADTSATLWDNPDSALARIDSSHWSVRAGARLPWKMLGGLLYSVLDSAAVPGMVDHVPVPIVGTWWSYIPTRDGMLRATLGADSVTDTASVLRVRLTRYAPAAP